MKPYLETKRVYLREFTTSDKDLVFDLNSDPDVMKYLTDSRPGDQTEAQRTLNIALPYIKKYEGRYGVWPAFLKSNNEFIGFYILRPCKNDPDNLKSIELGYRLKKKFWRQGFGSEVSEKLLERAFEYGAEEVFATARPDNHASTGVMKKIGMKFLKEYQDPALFQWFTDHNAVRYLITRAEYQALAEGARKK